MKGKMDTQAIEQAQAPMELVSQGATIVRLENAEQMAIAVQRPRDEAQILADSLHEIDLYPSMAREAIYNKPVGKNERGEMQYAEGLSVRAAESLGNRWNNSSYGVEIVSEDEDTATIAAVFLDYEKNTRHVAMQRVSKFYKIKAGQIVRYSPDRFDLVLKANSSKNLREIILRSLPAGLKKEYETKARNVLKKEPLAAQRTAIIERFSTLAISVEQLEAWKQKPMKEWKKEDVLEALGVVNALRDGELTIEGIFGKQERPGEKTEEKPGLVIKKKEDTTSPPPRADEVLPKVEQSSSGVASSNGTDATPTGELPLIRKHNGVYNTKLERCQYLEKTYPDIYARAVKGAQIKEVSSESAAIFVSNEFDRLFKDAQKKK